MSRKLRTDHNRRPAVTIVLTVVLLGVIFGCAALTVDLGVVFNTRHDLQIAADAAALSGVSAYALEKMAKIRKGTASLSAFGEIEYAAQSRAAEVTPRAAIFGTKGIVLDAHDITLGWLDHMSPTAKLRTDVPEAAFNAVQVVTRRTKESANGPAELFLARIFGVSTADVTATATAVFQRGHPEIDFWPFTLSLEHYELEVATGADNYEYDEGMEEVAPRPDGVREVHMYPNDEAPGNFGALNFGSSSSAYVLGEYVREGVNDLLLWQEFGYDFPSFVSDEGEPANYVMSGNPGISWSLKEDVDVRVGDVVVIFLHDGFVYNGGSNALYTIVDARHVRVMGIDYKNKGVWVQPVELTNEDDDLIGRAVLAR